jgi:hypothetical protein
MSNHVCVFQGRLKVASNTNLVSMLFIAPSNVETVNFRLNVEDSNMGSLTTLQNNMGDTKSIETRFVFEATFSLP